MTELRDIILPPNTTPPEYKCMVLLVDDQPMIGEAIRRALAGEPDIAFHYCHEPARAIEIAEKIKPTVILQDLVMPGIDGLTMVWRFRDDPATKDIPIIVLSTKEEATVKSAAFAQGANDYLVKLPEHIELIARIRYHSKAYLIQIQRDEAYKALRESQEQLVEKNIELAKLTNVDGLTGLNNRRYFNEFAEIQWRNAIREKYCVSILMVDVDDFKKYNDTYGHLAGDEALKGIGDAIKQAAQRPADLAARFGGEEFIVALTTATIDGGREVGNGLRQRVEQLRIPHNGTTAAGVVTVSIGCAFTVPQRGDSLLSLINVADRALYEAKRTGKNKVIALDGSPGAQTLPSLGPAIPEPH